MGDPLKALAPLESILLTKELCERSQRLPDHETENRALISLVRTLSDSHSTILQALADKTLDLLEEPAPRGSASLPKMVSDFTGLRLLACGRLMAAVAPPSNFGPAATCSTAMCRCCSLIGNVATLI